MPRVSLPISDVYIQVERPVAMDIVKSVLQLCGLGDGIPISFPGKAEEQPLLGSRTDKDKDVDSANFAHTSKMSVSFTEEYEESDFLTTTVHQHNHMNLFYDGNLEVRIAPIYIPTTGTLSLTYRCADEIEATQFRDRFRTKFSENRAELNLSASYNYSMPKHFMVILAELHRLRETKAGYGETFGQWYKKHASEKSTILTNMIGKQAIQAFRETQHNIVAWFDFTTPPPINKEQGAVRTVEFEFKYRYEKPAMMYMHWPMYVHQQVIPKALRGDYFEQTYDKMVGNKSRISQAMDYFRTLDTFPKGTKAGVTVPVFDEWINNYEHPHTANIITLVCSIDKPDNTNTLDLKALPYYKLAPEVIEYMKQHPKEQTRYGASPFLITLYEDGSRVSEEYLELTDDLILKLNFVPNLRRTYRLQISALLDLTVMAQKYLDKLLYSPKLCTMIFQSYFPGKEINVKPIAGKLFPKDIFWQYIRKAYHSPKHYKLNPEILKRQVGVYIIDIRSNKK